MPRTHRLSELADPAFTDRPNAQAAVDAYERAVASRLWIALAEEILRPTAVEVKSVAVADENEIEFEFELEDDDSALSVVE